MSDTPIIQPKASQHFRQFNALVDTHLRYAPTPILKAVLAVMRYANAEGESYVTPGTVAETTGMSLRNARRALADATAAGLLPVVTEGGGRGRSTLRRLALAETRAQCATVSGRKTRAQRNVKHGRSEALNTGAVEHETRAQCARPSAYSSAKTSSNTNSKGIVAGGDSSFSEEEKSQSFASLRGVGVSAAVPTDLAGSLCFAAIRRIVMETRDGHNLNNRAGLVVKNCKAEIESGAIGKEIALEALRAAQAEEARRLRQAEDERKAEERAAKNEEAAAWLKTLDAAEVSRLSEGLRYAFPAREEAAPSNPHFTRWLYQFSKDPEMQARAASAKAVWAERLAKAKADQEAKQAADQAADRVAAEKLAAAEAEKTRERTEWLDAQGDKLPAMAEAFFAKWPSVTLQVMAHPLW